MQIQREALGEYQARSASHSPILFVAFMTLTKSSGSTDFVPNVTQILKYWKLLEFTIYSYVSGESIRYTEDLNL